VGIKSPCGDGDERKNTPASVDGDGDGEQFTDGKFSVAIFITRGIELNVSIAGCPPTAYANNFDL